MDVLPTLIGALPQLGAMGVGLLLLTIFRRQQQADTADLRKQMLEERLYFRQERETIRSEAVQDTERTRRIAAEDRAELVAELVAAKAEMRDMDREIDQLRARLYPQNPATTQLPTSLPRRHRSGDAG